MALQFHQTQQNQRRANDGSDFIHESLAQQGLPQQIRPDHRNRLASFNGLHKQITEAAFFPIGETDEHPLALTQELAKMLCKIRNRLLSSFRLSVFFDDCNVISFLMMQISFFFFI